MATSATRQRPNVLLTGTPGVGKTTLATKVAENLGFTYIDAAHEIKANELYSEYDEERKCHVLNEDAFLDHLQDRFDSNEGGLVIDYHSCELFPERWFDFVFVVRCDNTVLYDRLTARGYDEKKIQENVECEIFGTIAEEAGDAYKEEVVHELTNESEEQIAKNVNLITQTVGKWRRK